MPEVHESQRLYALSGRPQDDYDTPTPAADPEDFVALQFTDKDFAKLAPGVSDNQEDAHGSEFPSEEYTESWDVEAPHSIACSSEIIGYLLLLAFGSVVTSQPDAINHPTVYQHIFTLLNHNVGRQLPVASLVEILGTAHNVMHPSMLLKMLSMSGDGVKRIDTGVQFHGSGREISPSGLSYAQVKALVDAQSLHYFFNSQAKATIADAGTLLNAENLSALHKFRSWSWSINNNPDVENGYAPGADKFQTDGDTTSGAIRAEMLNGMRELSASMVVRLRSDSEERAALKARKPLNWKSELTGGLISTFAGPPVTKFYHKLTVEFAKVRYTTLDLQSGGLITQNIAMKPFDAADVVRATLINTVPSYTD